jgi:hypothetical protein
MMRPVDHDSPEPEVLNLLETLTCMRVGMLIFAARIAQAQLAFRRLARAIADAVPPDDWEVPPSTRVDS